MFSQSKCRLRRSGVLLVGALTVAIAGPVASGGIVGATLNKFEIKHTTTIFDPTLPGELQRTSPPGLLTGPYPTDLLELPDYTFHVDGGASSGAHARLAWGYVPGTSIHAIGLPPWLPDPLSLPGNTLPAGHVTRISGTNEFSFVHEASLRIEYDIDFQVNGPPGMPDLEATLVGLDYTIEGGSPAQFSAECYWTAGATTAEIHLGGSSTYVYGHHGRNGEGRFPFPTYELISPAAFDGSTTLGPIPDGGDAPTILNVHGKITLAAISGGAFLRVWDNNFRDFMDSLTETGDANGDQMVDIFDVNMISTNWNTAGPQGDVNFDGLVDIFDVNLVSAHWGETPGAAAAVPEPSGVVLVALGALASVPLARRKRGRWRRAHAVCRRVTVSTRTVPRTR